MLWNEVNIYLALIHHVSLKRFPQRDRLWSLHSGKYPCVKMNFKNSFFFRWISSYVTNLRYDPKPKFQKNFIWKLKKMFLSKNNKNGSDFSCWQLFFTIWPSIWSKIFYVTQTKSCWPLKIFFLYIHVLKN